MARLTSAASSSAHRASELPTASRYSSSSGVSPPALMSVSTRAVRAATSVSSSSERCSSAAMRSASDTASLWHAEVLIAPTEPDACANDRWLLPTGRVLPFAHPSRPRVSDAPNVRREPSVVSRTLLQNVHRTEGA